MPAPHNLSEIDYDYRNLPVRMRRTDGLEILMRYDGAGQRIWKQTTTGLKEHYVMDGMDTVAELDDAGTVQHWNILAAGTIGRYTPDGSRRYYVKDHLGSIRQQVDHTGAILSFGADYYPFGLQMPGRTVENDGPDERFTGHELDAETGLYYAGARYIDPVVGRWNGVDPMADKFSGWSPYNYALNNPLQLADPTGMAPEDSDHCQPYCSGADKATRIAEGMWSKVNQKLTEAADATKKTVANVAETIVKNGPESLDNVNAASTYTTVAAGGAALITGPTPDDAVHLPVAAGSAVLAAATDMGATLLSQVDAKFYGGDQRIADIRLANTMLGFSVGNLAGGMVAGYLTRTMLAPVQQNALRMGIGTPAGNGAQAIATEIQRRP